VNTHPVVLPMSGFETDPLMQQWGQHPLVLAATSENRRSVAHYLEQQARADKERRDDEAYEAAKTPARKMVDRLLLSPFCIVLIAVTEWPLTALNWLETRSKRKARKARRTARLDKQLPMR
jgi:hypothetical protein